MPNVFMQNVQGTNATDDDNDMMVFTKKLGAADVKTGYAALGFPCDDCYEVPDGDVRVYLYSPLYLSEAEEKALKRVAAKFSDHVEKL